VLKTFVLKTEKIGVKIFFTAFFFLHQNFCFFLNQNFYFFYTKNFAFFTPNFEKDFLEKIGVNKLL